jgi:enoyl-CoA hydratase/carnithine racemase
MTAQLKSHSQGSTLVLTISNPEHRNALDPAMYSAGVEALNVAETNPDVKTVVITGEGKHFCAGGNLNRILINRTAPADQQSRGIDALHSWIEAIRTFPKPVIAAVEGAAAGAGFSLVLACDMVVASADSVFVMAYTSVGLSPDGGGSWFLSRALPRALANQFMMLGERISAQRLADAGLINQISPTGEALHQALALAEQLNHRAPNALASIKELTAQAADQDLFAHLQTEQQHFLKNLNHANAGIGIQAFLDKRTPHYKP